MRRICDFVGAEEPGIYICQVDMKCLRQRLHSVSVCYCVHITLD